MTDQTPEQGEPGFGRDEDLEPTRRRHRPAEADLDATRKKAERDPIHYAPDPDAEDGGRPNPEIGSRPRR